MKKVLRFIDLFLLRVFPILILTFIIFSLVLESAEYLQKENTFSFWHDIDSFSFFFCLAFLGLSSILKFFNKTLKVSIIIKYLATLLALFFVILSFLEILNYLNQNTIDTPRFFDYYIPKIQRILNMISAILIIISCLLKDNFFKTKYFFAISTIILIFVTYHLPKFYFLFEFNDTSLLRFSFWEILFLYAQSAIIITCTAPAEFRKSAIQKRKEEI